MRKIALYILVSFSILSCKEKGKAPLQEGNELLIKIMETYGAPQISESTVRFSVNDLHYTLERNKHLAEFKLTRNLDGINYIATYKNGYQEYFIDGIKQEDGTYSRFQLTQYLDAFTFLQGIPHVFNGNDIIAEKEKPVTILGKKYYTLHISYKPFEGSPEDEFYLYIDPETNYIIYLSEKYQLNGEGLRFLKFVDHRYVNSILFADYYIMSPLNANEKVEELYNVFNARDVKEEQKIILSDISVTLN